jgi:carboxylesterase
MDSQSEPPPSDPSVDTSEFFFEGDGLSALLVHGLTGTPYEMRYLGERMAAAGIRVRGVRLAGHAGAPEELGQTTHENWYESVVQGFEELRRYGQPNVVIGLSAGAVLVARLAAEQREAVSGLVMLSPAFFLPVATTAALKGVQLLGPHARRIYLYGETGSDIHDHSARLVHPSSRLMPLAAPIELLKLSALVRQELPKVLQPTLIIHSALDHVCPCDRNVKYLMEHLGSRQKRSLILKESFHVITVDSEKQRVADEVIAFAMQFRTQIPRRSAAGGY